MKKIIEKLKQIENEEKDINLKTALDISIMHLEIINAVFEKRKQNGIKTKN